MKLKSLFLLVCALSLGLSPLYASSSKLLGMEEGLSCSLSNYIYQDRAGMIWIATEDGLNQFNGVNIKKYRHREGDEHSIAHNFVRSIIEDAEGRLIVATYAGTQLYRRETDDFSAPLSFVSGKAMT